MDEAQLELWENRANADETEKNQRDWFAANAVKERAFEHQLDQMNQRLKAIIDRAKQEANAKASKRKEAIDLDADEAWKAEVQTLGALIESMILVFALDANKLTIPTHFSTGAPPPPNAPPPGETLAVREAKKRQKNQTHQQIKQNDHYLAQSLAQENAHKKARKGFKKPTLRKEDPALARKTEDKPFALEETTAEENAALETNTLEATTLEYDYDKYNYDKYNCGKYNYSYNHSRAIVSTSTDRLAYEAYFVFG